MPVLQDRAKTCILHRLLQHECVVVHCIRQNKNENGTIQFAKRLAFIQVQSFRKCMKNLIESDIHMNFLASDVPVLVQHFLLLLS